MSGTGGREASTPREDEALDPGLCTLGPAGNEPAESGVDGPTGVDYLRESGTGWATSAEPLPTVPPPMGSTMADEHSRRHASDPSEGLGSSIDRLFKEMGQEGGAEERVVADTPPEDRPPVPSFPESARTADLLDDVEIRPMDPDEDRAESERALKALEAQILREQAARSQAPTPVRKKKEEVTLIPLGASVMGGLEEIPVEEWSFEEASRKLAETVDAYLSSTPGSREEATRHLRGLAWRLQEWGNVEPVGNAVMRLVMGATPEDPEPSALARKLLTPPIARWITARLGAEARDEARRLELVEVVSRLGEDMASALGDALTETTERVQRRAFVDALVALGDDALRVAEDMTFHERWFVVRNGILVLRDIAGEHAIGLYTAALGHEDPRVRREALLALAHVGGEKAIMLVPGKLADSDPEVRQGAAIAAGALKAPRAVRPLLEQLDEEEDPEVQSAILLALGQIGDPSAVQAIEKRASGTLLRKPPTQVRIAAYRALASIGTPRARKLLKEATSDRDPQVREAAQRAQAELIARKS